MYPTQKIIVLSLDNPNHAVIVKRIHKMSETAGKTIFVFIK